MTFGSLFAGIGGLDLGLERAGMTCHWQVEIDEYANKVLQKHWPAVRRWNDIRTFPPEGNWDVDLICGGFPCQDISFAGKGAGLHGARSGLFFEAIRVVETVRPRWVLLENVAALLVRGLPEVLGTLASIGFDAEWHCIPAASVGAPHIRDRVFVLGRNSSGGNDGAIQAWNHENTKPKGACGEEASTFFPHTAGIRCTESADGPLEDGQHTQARKGRLLEPSGAFAAIPDSNNTRLERRQVLGRDAKKELQATERSNRESGGQWDTEPAVGRVADGISNRVDRLRGLGNAVVPQVAEFIGRQIMSMESKPKE